MKNGLLAFESPSHQPPVCPGCGKPLRLYIVRALHQPARPEWVAVGCADCGYAEDEAGKLKFWAGGIIVGSKRQHS